jgi:hypothetical protein
MLRGIGYAERNRVSSKEELRERITQYFDDLDKMSVIFKWKYKIDYVRLPNFAQIVAFK